MSAIETVLEVLEGVRKSGTGWSAKCPAHEDRAPSLSITEGADGKVLLFCHAGCDFASIVSALGLEEGDLFPPKDASGKRIVAEYSYCDEAGAELSQSVRYEPKDFRQRHRLSSGAWEWSLNGIRRVPYHLPELLEGVEAGATVYVVEGEKDVDSLRSLGLVATCNAGGAGKWRPEFSEYLKGARVVIIADKDEPGRKHAASVEASLRGKAASVRVVEVPKGKDSADWIAHGASREDFEKLATAEESKPTIEAGVFDIAGILERSKTSGPRFLTGIVALDERLSPRHDPTKHGFPRGRIAGVNGAPHAGKSVILDQIALAAARADLRVVILVSDEPREDAAERIGQGLGFRHAEMNADFPETLARVREAECYQNIVILPDENVGPVTIEGAAEILFSVEASGYVLAVDSLHKSRSSAENDDDAPRVGIDKRLDAFRVLRNRGADVLFSAEANRSFYASSDPSQRSSAMASGAESRAIEFTADLLLTLRRDGDDFRVEIPKNRIGRQYEPFTVRLNEGSASFRSIEEGAVQMEKDGRRAEALLPLEDKIVELLRTAPAGMSGHALDMAGLGPRRDVRDARDSAFKKEKIARLPGARGGGFLYRVDRTSPTSPEPRRNLAGQVVPMLANLAVPPLGGGEVARLESPIGGASENHQLPARFAAMREHSDSVRPVPATDTDGQVIPPPSADSLTRQGQTPTPPGGGS